MFRLARKTGKTVDGQIEDFSFSSTYHDMRGEYVYEKVISHHKKSRAWIQQSFPDVVIASSIPISNSFKLVASKQHIQEMEKNEQILEIHTNESFQAKLPNERADLSEAQGVPKVPPRFIDISDSHKSKDGVQWNVAKIGADRVWKMKSASSHGEGAIYAIADTGVSYLHPILRENYLGLKGPGSYNHNYAWYDGVRESYSTEKNSACRIRSEHPCDDRGHGTHVAGTAVGSGGYGVAPGAKWMACRNMDGGVGRPESYLACLNFFLAPHDLRGENPNPKIRPHAIGNSYGCPETEECSKSAFNSAVVALRAAGIFMSASAGNDGPQCGTVQDPPALEKSVVSVGATDQNDKLASFSSRGPSVVGSQSYPKPNVVAPGVKVLSSYLDGTFQALSGTSMASPHVGAAVLLISKICPCISRDIDAIQELLQATAVHIPPPAGQQLCGDNQPDSIPNNYFGYGRIEVFAAVRACLVLCGQHKSPRVLQ